MCWKTQWERTLAQRRAFISPAAAMAAVYTQEELTGYVMLCAVASSRDRAAAPCVGGQVAHCALQRVNDEGSQWMTDTQQQQFA
jgi:hypothetical protein